MKTNDVLDGIGESVTHMKGTSDVGRGNNDDKLFASVINIEIRRRMEKVVRFPPLIPR